MLANHPSPLSKAVTGETRGDLRSYMHSTTVAALSAPTNEVTELSSCLAGQASESTLIVANASVLCSARWRKRRITCVGGRRMLGADYLLELSGRANPSGHNLSRPRRFASSSL